MIYGIKYIYLIELFLDKRNPSKGGVEGYNTPFVVNEKDFGNYSLNYLEAIDMIKIMETETVRPQDEDGEKYGPVPVIAEINENKDSLEIIDCTTAKLQQFKKKIKNDLEKSAITINKKYPSQIWYGNSSKMRLTKGKRRKAFWVLYKNAGVLTTYDQIARELAGSRDQYRIDYNTKGEAEIKKEVQNTVAGLKERMDKHNFLPNSIENIHGKGYRLAI